MLDAVAVLRALRTAIGGRGGGLDWWRVFVPTAMNCRVCTELIAGSHTLNSKPVLYLGYQREYTGSSADAHGKVRGEEYQRF